jgi:alpha-tubulin suppressor-like RCC1 family protein
MTTGDQPGEMPPVDVDFGIGTPVEIRAGYYATWLLLASGDVRIWGYNADGNLGNYEANVAVGLARGDAPGEMPPPDVVLGGAAVILLKPESETRHSCALLEDNSVRCWGLGSGGRLGNGSTEDVGDEPGEMPPAPISLY